MPIRNDPLKDSSEEDTQNGDQVYNLYDRFSNNPHSRPLNLSLTDRREETQAQLIVSQAATLNDESGIIQNSDPTSSGSKNSKEKQLQQSFPCPVAGCNVVLAKKSYVKKHLETHTKHRSYGCDLCDVTCRQYAGLYVHYN